MPGTLASWGLLPRWGRSRGWRSTKAWPSATAATRHGWWLRSEGRRAVPTADDALRARSCAQGQRPPAEAWLPLPCGSVGRGGHARTQPDSGDQEPF